MKGAMGTMGLTALSLSLAMGIATGLNGFYISTSRLMFAQGRAKFLPESFGQLHPKYRTPTVGIITTCCICLIAPWFGREVLLWIVDMASTGVAIAYFYCCAAAYRCFKWTEKSEGKNYEGCVSPFKKSLSALGAISALSFLALLFFPGSPGALKTPSLIALMIWGALGIAMYIKRRKFIHGVSEEHLNRMILASSDG